MGDYGQAREYRYTRGENPSGHSFAHFGYLCFSKFVGNMPSEMGIFVGRMHIVTANTTQQSPYLAKS